MNDNRQNIEPLGSFIYINSKRLYEKGYYNSNKTIAEYYKQRVSWQDIPFNARYQCVKAIPLKQWYSKSFVDNYNADNRYYNGYYASNYALNLYEVANILGCNIEDLTIFHIINTWDNNQLKGKIYQNDLFIFDIDVKAENDAQKAELIKSLFCVLKKMREQNKDLEEAYISHGLLPIDAFIYDDTQAKLLLNKDNKLIEATLQDLTKYWFGVPSKNGIHLYFKIPSPDYLNILPSKENIIPCLPYCKCDYLFHHACYKLGEGGISDPTLYYDYISKLPNELSVKNAIPKHTTHTKQDIHQYHFDAYRVFDRVKKDRTFYTNYKDVPIDRIIADLPIKLTDRGYYLTGCCPFHSEQVSSFSIHKEYKCFTCFSCGEKGSIFDLVMRLKGFTVAQTKLYFYSF